ncbi:MAG: hypothetical protein LBB84_05965 [Tannerellaceae bacterium]|jgi:hypothetical protein|nr:hypothetical protein [Tannerellaceae bacterium]
MAIYVWLLFAYHQRRKDKMFITSLYQNVHMLYLMEYTVVSIPLFILIAISGNLKLIPIAACCLIAVAYIPPFSHISFPKLHYDKVFPNSYEWISGSRTSAVYLIIFYILSVSVLFKTFMAFFVYLFILFQCTNFYKEGESVSLLCLPEKRATAYIKEKVTMAIRNFHRLSSLFYLLFIFFYPSMWWILVALSASATTVFIFCICWKYAHYIPNEKNAGNEIALSLGILGAVTPFFPLIFVLSIHYFLLARKNLKIYLDAYNQ